MQIQKLMVCGVAWLVGLWGVAGCGCGDINCSPCMPSGITIRVRDAAVDIPVKDATVIAGGKTCPLKEYMSPGQYVCDVEPGTYSIEVIAPGHQSQTISVTLNEVEDSGACCACGPQASAEVSLDPM